MAPCASLTCPADAIHSLSPIAPPLQPSDNSPSPCTEHPARLTQRPRSENVILGPQWGACARNRALNSTRSCVIHSECLRSNPSVSVRSESPGQTERTSNESLRREQHQWLANLLARSGPDSPFNKDTSDDRDLGARVVSRRRSYSAPGVNVAQKNGCLSDRQHCRSHVDFVGRITRFSSSPPASPGGEGSARIETAGRDSSTSWASSRFSRWTKRTSSLSQFFRRSCDSPGGTRAQACSWPSTDRHSPSAREPLKSMRGAMPIMTSSSLKTIAALRRRVSTASGVGNPTRGASKSTSGNGRRASCSGMAAVVDASNVKPDGAEMAKARATKRAQLIEEQVMSELHLRNSWKNGMGYALGLKAEIAKNRATQRAHHSYSEFEAKLAIKQHYGAKLRRYSSPTRSCAAQQNCASVVKWRSSPIVMNGMEQRL